MPFNAMIKKIFENIYAGKKLSIEELDYIQKNFFLQGVPDLKSELPNRAIYLNAYATGVHDKALIPRREYGLAFLSKEIPFKFNKGIELTLESVTSFLAIVGIVKIEDLEQYLSSHTDLLGRGIITPDEKNKLLSSSHNKRRTLQETFLALNENGILRLNSSTLQTARSGLIKVALKVLQEKIKSTKSQREEIKKIIEYCDTLSQSEHFIRMDFIPSSERPLRECYPVILFQYVAYLSQKDNQAREHVKNLDEDSHYVSHFNSLIEVMADNISAYKEGNGAISCHEGASERCLDHMASVADSLSSTLQAINARYAANIMLFFEDKENRSDLARKAFLMSYYKNFKIEHKKSIQLADGFNNITGRNIQDTIRLQQGLFEKLNQKKEQLKEQGIIFTPAMESNIKVWLKRVWDYREKSPFSEEEEKQLVATTLFNKVSTKKVTYENPVNSMDEFVQNMADKTKLSEELAYYALMGVLIGQRNSKKIELEAENKFIENTLKKVSDLDAIKAKLLDLSSRLFNIDENSQGP
jgi:hypothetical protein